MAAYVPRGSWQYRDETYDEGCDPNSDCDREDEEYKHFILNKIVKNCLPETWSDMDVQLVELDRDSAEFQKVVSRIRWTLKINVERVDRVQNPFLWASYLLRKEEYKKRLKKQFRVMKMFHATSEDNVPSIVESNFDWRRTVRAKFGVGVSFSPFAQYTNKYCNPNVGANRALILTRVLVGRCQIGSFGRKMPGESYDTSVGNGNRVYIKYGDNEYYPEYVAYYTYN